MEVTHELILGLTDIDRLSIKCKSCGAEFVVSLNLLSDATVADESSTNRQIPAKCPSCPRDWSDIRKAVRDFGPSMEAMRQCEGLSFRVTMPASESRK
jgi:hypothetical protein